MKHKRQYKCFRELESHLNTSNIFAVKIGNEPLEFKRFTFEEAKLCCTDYARNASTMLLSSLSNRRTMLALLAETIMSDVAVFKTFPKYCSKLGKANDQVKLQ